MGIPVASEEILTLPDERAICYAIYGDQNAPSTVFYHHGLPGCHLEARLYHDAAKRHNIRLVSMDRPGLGRSTFQPNRRLLDWPPDLLALADHLRVDRFVVLRVSGGGPYALVCLHLPPKDRCIGGGVVAGMYPAYLGTDGMALLNRILLRLVPTSPWLVEKAIDYMLGTAARDTKHPENLERMIQQSFRKRNGPDQTCMQNDEKLLVNMLECLRSALSSGSTGAAWEVKIVSSDWGFNLEDINIEEGTMVAWHGGLDTTVPVLMARRARELIKGVEWRFSEQDGHVSIYATRIEEVMVEMKAICTG
ncbi:unnamed protein product [Clonostachys rosea]|uniref:AB hydrolase-1 domain-containing protein n=1 Tax=Bionectria ochroleuca TaxID=29856 RepID=A0ABY6UQX5_BIOOC|nr:unnamed protein product [Clonostachys rosea]